jgi:hypothetical protein
MLPVRQLIHQNHHLTLILMASSGSLKIQSTTQSTGPTSHSTSTPAMTQTSIPSNSASSPAKTSQVNAVQSASSPQPGGKKKNKNKSKKTYDQTESLKTQTQPPIVDKQPQRKLKFPCLMCGEDHYTRDCPHRDEVTKFLKGNSQPVVLTNPFPPQQQTMVAQNPAPPQGGNTGHPPSGDASSSSHVYMFNGTVDLMTRTNTYDTPPGKTNNESVANGPMNEHTFHFCYPSVWTSPDRETNN